MPGARSVSKSSELGKLPSRQFRSQVKDALENLYDPVYLKKHPLTQTLVPTVLAGDIRGAKLLRRRVLEAIELLKPSERAAGAEKLWRTYRILDSRYVAALPYREVMCRLGLSQAQYHREQRRAIEALTIVLWETRLDSDIDMPPPVPLVVTRANLSSFNGTKPPARKRHRLPRNEQEYVWVAANTDDPFYQDGKQGWEAAARALGVAASFVGPGDANLWVQLQALEEAIAKPTTAGILAYPLSFSAADPLLRKARQLGIAVVLGNADAEDDALRDAFVGPVNTELGSHAAMLAAELLQGEGRVGVIGFMGKSPRTRVRAFEQELATAHPGIELEAVLATDGSCVGARVLTDSLLNKHPGIDLIYVPEARSSPAVAAAVWERGLSSRVMIIGTDRSSSVLDAIAKGTITATVVQDTYAEEYIALHYLFWRYNNLTAIPDTSVVRTDLHASSRMPGTALRSSLPYARTRQTGAMVQSGYAAVGK
jgi:ABC-type sugar transport system substrate-binding protein